MQTLRLSTDPSHNGLAAHSSMVSFNAAATANDHDNDDGGDAAAY